MSNEKQSFWKRYGKDILKTATAVYLVFYVAVFAWVWSDRNYNSDFWPDFFLYSGIAFGVLIIVGWAIGWAGQNRRR